MKRAISRDYWLPKGGSQSLCLSFFFSANNSEAKFVPAGAPNLINRSALAFPSKFSQFGILLLHGGTHSRAVFMQKQSPSLSGRRLGGGLYEREELALTGLDATDGERCMNCNAVANLLQAVARSFGLLCESSKQLDFADLLNNRLKLA